MMEDEPGTTGLIETISASMIEPILHLNNANTPHVNALTSSMLETLIEMADGAWASIDARGALAGFALVMGPGKPYESLNYCWFEQTFAHFHYLDRIVVTPSHRRHGVGTLLYDRVFTEARRAGVPRVCCEVNLSPPNPGSIAFHEGLGFQGVGEQATEAGQKQVLLMVRSIESEEGQ